MVSGHTILGTNIFCRIQHLHLFAITVLLIFLRPVFNLTSVSSICCLSESVWLYFFPRYLISSFKTDVISLPSQYTGFFLGTPFTKTNDLHFDGLTISLPQLKNLETSSNTWWACVMVFVVMLTSSM